MVVDRIENAGLYMGLGGRIAAALRYVVENDFTALEPGRYDLEGDDLFALVSDYTTKDNQGCRLEGHRRYIDVQYVVCGEEWIGWTPLREQPEVHRYDEEKDYAFFEGAASFVRVGEGMFAIFFPDDLHMPGTGKEPVAVRKVVVKVRI